MKLLETVLRAALSVAVVWWAVATATFLLMRAVPGGPLSKERRVPEAVRLAIEEQYRLNDPAFVQYARYLKEAALFRFGVSFENRGRGVGEIVRERLPRSALLGAISLSLSLALAFVLGTAAAMRRGGAADRALAFAAAAGVSVPSFILASGLLYVFAFKLRLFPTSGWRGAGSAILPALALAAMPAAYMARLVRAGLVEVLGSEFILAARARGLSRPRAVVAHGLPHVCGPVLAYLGPQMAAIMTGSFVIEKIFNIPGLGLMYVQSIGNRDYPLIMGVTLVYTVMLVAFNLLGDALARAIDPRIGADRPA